MQILPNWKGHGFCRTMGIMRRHPPVVAFLVASPFELLDLAGPVSVFERATVNGKRYYSIQILSVQSSGTAETKGGITIGNVRRYSDYEGPIDTLIAVGGEAAVAEQPQEILKWLRKRAAHTRRVASVCTGAFILAGTGLLDGRRVATHWRYCDLLKRRYKHLKVERDPIFIKDDKFYTTAGVSAGIDLSLALVEEDLGHAAAAAIARTLVLFLRRPGGQAQYSTVLAQQEDIDNARMRDLPVWVRAHLSRKLDVETLADVAAMSSRTFVRQFKAQFNETPARWVQSLRVEAAMQHLENRDLSLGRIALVTGFRDEQALRRAFLQQIAVTPKQYRERFGELDRDSGAQSGALHYA